MGVLQQDAQVNTVDDAFTSDKNFVNFGPAIPEFYRRVCGIAHDEPHARLCQAFLFNHILQMAPVVGLRAGRVHAGLCHASS